MARVWDESKWKRDKRGRFSGSSAAGKKARKVRDRAASKASRARSKTRRKEQARKERADVRGAIRPGVAVAAWRKRKKRR